MSLTDLFFTDAACTTEKWIPLAMAFAPVSEEEAVKFRRSLCLWAAPDDLYTIADSHAAWNFCISECTIM